MRSLRDIANLYQHAPAVPIVRTGTMPHMLEMKHAKKRINNQW